jgi:hypothetical protein
MAADAASRTGCGKMEGPELKLCSFMSMPELKMQSKLICWKGQ